jgi:asparagine synthase (glutamine-hydrolysing)
MASSVEGRVPLLDHRIVEFAYSLPETFNPLFGNEKGLLKKVVEPYLPSMILNRKKEGFNAPMHVWVRENPKVIIENLIEKPSPVLKDLIDIKILKKWLDNSKNRFQAGESLYALYFLNLWLCANIKT